MGWLRDRFDDWSMGPEAAAEMRASGSYEDGEYDFFDDDEDDDEEEY